MRISGNYSVHKNTGIDKKKNTQSGGIFSLSTNEPNEQAVGNQQPVSSNSAIYGLLAAQEVEEFLSPEIIKERAEHLLSHLETLHRFLLEGKASSDTLMHIERQLSTLTNYSTNPALNEIIQSIELRLAVELAKLSK